MALHDRFPFFMLMQLMCLLACVASIWIPHKFAAAYALMSGVALSRLGLWMFDLSVIQQMQVILPDDHHFLISA